MAKRRAPRVGLRSGKGKHYTLAEKLAARVIHESNGCWSVQGTSNNQAGHVHLSSGSWAAGTLVQTYAHIYAWEQANDCKVPDGLVVMHTCDNPRCVNPDHLRVDTQRANIIDSIHKGRYNCFGRQKLDAAKVLDIRAMADLGITQRDIGRQFGVGRSAISAVVNGKTWAHVQRAVVLVLALFVAAPCSAQDRVGPAPYLVLTIGNTLDLATTLHGIHGGRAKEGNPLWTSAGTAGFVAIKTGSALAMGLAMRQLATHGHPRAAKVLGYTTGFALVGVGVHNARVARR